MDALVESPGRGSELAPVDSAGRRRGQLSVHARRLQCARPAGAFGLVEVLVALAILSFAMWPIFNMFRGSRGMLDQSREMLSLQTRALEALWAGRERVSRGACHGLAPGSEIAEDVNQEGYRSTLTYIRHGDRPMIRVKVETRHDGKAFLCWAWVADPGAGAIEPADEHPVLDDGAVTP